MPLYNLTAVSAGNGTLELVQNVNTHLVSGWFGVILLGVIWAILFISFLGSERKPIKSFTAASFLAFGLSIFLFTMSLIPMMAVWISLVATAIGTAFWNLD